MLLENKITNFSKPMFYLVKHCISWCKWNSLFHNFTNKYSISPVLKNPTYLYFFLMFENWICCSHLFYAFTVSKKELSSHCNFYFIYLMLCSNSYVKRKWLNLFIHHSNTRGAGKMQFCCSWAALDLVFQQECLFTSWLVYWI